MTELLAPAGSVEALRSAINAGCDAVYIGGKMFGARAYADNPDRDELLAAIDHCHTFDKKIYLTVNTLLKNNELTEDLYVFLRPYYEEGLDGVIVSDPGVMQTISDLFPGLPIHISTQASVTSAEGTHFFKGLSKSITRVVPARELSIEEVELFKKNTDLEVEVFVHGAMCVSYSGQCLMSSMAGGRSGNRGRCAQPCRKSYDSGFCDSFILSCKDMCTIKGIGRLMRAGIDSFKIEGRMKSPVYVAATVSTYRKYMDIAFKLGDRYEDYLVSHNLEIESDIDRLREIYNRGGFSAGFMLGDKKLIYPDRASHCGVYAGVVKKVSGREATIVYDRDINASDVLEIRRNDGSTLYEYTSGKDESKGASFGILVSKGQKAVPGERVFRIRNNKLIDEINNRYIISSIKRKAGISFKAAKGQRISLTAYVLPKQPGSSVTVTSFYPDVARTASAQKESIIKHLCKSGDYPFEIVETEVSLEDGLFIPVGVLNALRREAFDGLLTLLKKRFFRDNKVQDIKGCFDRYASLAAVTGNGDTAADITASALVMFECNVGPVIDDERIKRVYLSPVKADPDKRSLERYLRLAESLKESGRELYIALPYICRAETLSRIKVSGIIEALHEKCGFLVRNNEELSLFENDNGAGLILDHTMHIFNRSSAALYDREFTYSPELNRTELESFGMPGQGEMIVYGRTVLMQTAHCVYRNSGVSCTAGKSVSSQSEVSLRLKDEKQYVFPVIRNCDYCTNLILNSSVLDLRENTQEIKRIAPKSVRYEFTMETPEEIRMILDGKRPEGVRYTSGHFKRGVL